MAETPVKVLTRHFASKPHAEDAIKALESAGYRIVGSEPDVKVLEAWAFHFDEGWHWYREWYDVTVAAAPLWGDKD